MVTDTGATPSPGGIRPLDTPRPVRVEVASNDMPAGIWLEPVLSSHAPVGRRRPMKIDCATANSSKSSPRADTPPVRRFDKLRAGPELVEGPPYFENSETEGLGAGPSKGKRREVSEVLDAWRIDDEWWREQPVSRLYYRAVLEDGTMTGLFKDLISGDWYSQRV